jgi:hypothetical protein
MPFLIDIYGLPAVFGGDGLVTLALEHFAADIKDEVFIINQKDGAVSR